MTTSSAGDLESLIAALARPGVLPGGGEGAPEVVHTHISAVFLSGERAFKLKKPVNFGFLDFSTAAKRERCCREELRLNRRLAPDYYLGLAPVWRRPGGGVDVGQPSDEPPPSDDVLVVMSRLPTDRMMDRLLAAGHVAPENIERLARLIAAFHERAERGPDVDRWGSREAAGRLALDNFDQTERFCGALFDTRRHRLGRARTANFLETRDRLFAARVQSGAVRDVHGDLHSPNVCLLSDGRPVVYDCIEFSPQYRCCDVASEVAFMAMDLEFRGRRDLADAFLATYRAQFHDPSLEAILPFYRAHRAMVRAKVSALTSAAEELPAPERERHGAAARRLFDLAEGFSRGLTPPALVVLAGLTGVGKTVVAAELRRISGMVPLETDRIRKHLAGLDPDQPARAALGEGIYTEAMSHATYRTLAREAATRLERGESALAVGTFVKPEQRDEIRETARQARVPLLFVRLTASASIVVERLARRPPGASDADERVFRSMAAHERPPEEIPDGERMDLDSSSMSPGELAETVLARLRREDDRGRGQ